MIMKKYIIIAAAALVAATACSKVETVETPDEAISFKVANYTPATRAEVSLNSEEIYQFKTWAWVHPNGGATGEAFMVGETVTPDNNNAPTAWVPSRAYYWPKNKDSYINFFSFTSNGDTPKVPTVVNEGSFKYDGATIVPTDNILAAEAAYGYKSNVTTYKQVSGVEAGVPTLFHHLLSQVKFDVKLDAQKDLDGKTISDKYSFKVVINSATVTYANKGSLTLNFSAPSSLPGQSPFTTVANYIGWEKTAGAAANTLAPKSTDAIMTDGITVKGGSASAATTLIDWSSVMPQVLGKLAEAATETTEATPATGDVKIALTYTLTTTYKNSDSATDPLNTEFSEQIVIPATPLTAFNDAIDSWYMNYKYIYHITIKAVDAKQIIFDPAVVEWIPSATEPTFTVPVNE